MRYRVYDATTQEVQDQLLSDVRTSRVDEAADGEQGRVGY